MHLLSSALPELMLLATFIILSFTEYFWPNLQYVPNRSWFQKLFWLQMGGIILTYAVGWFYADESLYPLFPKFSEYFSGIPSVINGLIGYVCVTFINYWWHRFRHQSDLLWRVFHQIHHSTHRLQTATAMYSHPLDYASTIFIINVVAYVIFGFDALSAAWTITWVGMFELWEHTNIRTPHWLGYLIVRPEMHRIHHEFNCHRNNYGLPVWDILFGTYENSLREVTCGFKKDREAKLSEMLRFIDVHK